MIIFHNFEHSSLPISITKQNKNNYARNCKWHSYHSMQFLYKPLLNLPKNLGKKTQAAKNTEEWSFFITLNTPPCPSQSQNKIKTITLTTTSDTLIVSCNSNIIHSSSCLKTWGKGPNRLKAQKNDLFS